MGNLYSRIHPAPQAENNVPVSIPREDLALHLYLPHGVHTKIAAGNVVYSPSEDRLCLEDERREVRVRDELNDPPEAKLAYSEAEMLALNEWRVRVLETIDDRVRRYCNRPGSNQPMPASAGSGINVQKGSKNLALAGPSATPARSEHRALQVLNLWTTYCDSATGKPCWQAGTYAPSGDLDYGQELNTLWLKPTQKEQDTFLLRYRQFIQDTANNWETRKCIYSSAVFTQLDDLPDSLFDTLNAYVKFQIPSNIAAIVSPLHPGNPHPPPWFRHGIPDFHDGPRWLDLSQFILNPYFEGLFGGAGRLKHDQGKWEIILRDDPSNPLIYPARFPSDLLNLIGPMYITQPPCKALGIYQMQRSITRDSYEPLQWANDANATLNPLYAIRNADGIKAHELLEALQASVHQLRETWVGQAHRLRDRIPEAHWLDDIWGYPGVPRFFVVLENMEMNHRSRPYISRKPAYVYEQPEK